MQLKKFIKDVDYTCFYFYLTKMFLGIRLWIKLLSERKRFSSQNKIETSYYIGYFILLESSFRSFDLEIDISTLKMKLNY